MRSPDTELLIVQCRNERDSSEIQNYHTDDEDDLANLDTNVEKQKSGCQFHLWQTDVAENGGKAKACPSSNICPICLKTDKLSGFANRNDFTGFFAGQIRGPLIH